MGSDSSKTALEKLCKWVESLPQGSINWTINKNPSVNTENLDYFVDYEIIITPENSNALGITVWIDNDANGFFISEFKLAAKILNVKVRNGVSNLACSGSEPTTNIDIDSIIKLCNEISSATLDFRTLILNGRLEGVYSEVSLSNGIRLPMSIGTPNKLAKLLVATGIAVSKSIPYEPWV